MAIRTEISIESRRRILPQFRQRSEFPKHLFLANLGITKEPASIKNNVEPHQPTTSADTQGEENRESHKP